MWTSLSIYTNTLITYIYKPRRKRRAALWYNVGGEKIQFSAKTVISPYSLLIRLTLEIIFSLFAKSVHICTNTSVASRMSVQRQVCLGLQIQSGCGSGRRGSCPTAATMATTHGNSSRETQVQRFRSDPPVLGSGVNGASLGGCTLEDRTVTQTLWPKARN